MKRLVPLLLLLVVVPSAAAAQGRNQYLEEARRRLARHQPDKAVDELRRALTLPGLPVDQEVEILGLLGACLQMSGRPAEAVQPWEERVRLAPDAPLAKDLPRAVQQAYVDVREATVIIEHVPPPAAFAARPLTLQASLVDKRGRAGDLLVYYRRKGEPDWAVAPLRREGDSWSARLRLPPVAGSADGYDLEYYLVAQARSGEVLHAEGSPSRPLRVPVMAAAADPAERAGESIAAVDVREVPDPADHGAAAVHEGGPVWLWVGLGVLAAGALAGGAYYMASRPGDVPPTTLGVIHYPLGGEDPR